MRFNSIALEKKYLFLIGTVLITVFRRIVITLMLKTLMLITMNQKTATFFLKAGLSRIVFTTKFFLETYI